ncbi:MAG: archaellin/type IV pilin N-terminal domain-containing protein [Candidatus Aenigmatarchaeota archaeon]
MKGISPLVATVLLIAITMSVAGILAFWVSSFTSQTLPKYNRTEECRFSNFEIYSCTLDRATGTLTFILRNTGQYDIQGLTAFIILKNNIVTPTINLNPSSLMVGEYKSFILPNSTTNVPAEQFSKLIVGTSVCPDLSKESTCGVYGV